MAPRKKPSQVSPSMSRNNGQSGSASPQTSVEQTMPGVPRNSQSGQSLSRVTTSSLKSGSRQKVQVQYVSQPSVLTSKVKTSEDYLLLQLANPLQMAECWPDWAITVTHAGLDAIKIHEAILLNQVDILYNMDYRVAFVLTRSLHCIMHTWDAFHVMGGWAKENISPIVGELHRDLMHHTRKAGSRFLIYNPDSLFLQQLVARVGGGWLWPMQQ